MFGYNGYGNSMMGGYHQPVQGYQNPYQSRLDSMQRIEIVKVNGQNGAMAFNMPPNSSILLLDENDPIVWFVQTDGAGYKTVKPYQIAPYKAEPTPDARSLEARIKRLEDIINGKPDFAGTDQTGDAKPAISE